MGKKQVDEDYARAVVLRSVPVGCEQFIDLVISEVCKRQSPIELLKPEVIIARFEELRDKYNTCPDCHQRLMSTGLCSYFACGHCLNFQEHAKEYVGYEVSNDNTLKNMGIKRLNIINTRSSVEQVCEGVARALRWHAHINSDLNKYVAFKSIRDDEEISNMCIIVIPCRNTPDSLYRYYAVEAMKKMCKAETVGSIPGLAGYIESIDSRGSVLEVRALECIDAEWIQESK